MHQSQTSLAITVLGACALLACVGCPSGSALPPPINIGSSLEAAYVGVELGAPSGLAATADGRVFFTEKNTGRIRAVRDGVLRDEPVFEVPANYAGDGGLLGVALDPRFGTNGRLYVFYTRSDIGEVTDDPRAILDHRVVYVEVDPASDVATSGEIFVASIPPGTTTSRVGGGLAFGDDGMLYVAVGDGGDANAAQTELLQGKILRWNPDGSIPEDNPSPDSPIFARGFTDPRVLAPDFESASMFALDQTRANLCEINVLRANGNYGWPAVAGFVDNDDERTFVNATPTYAEPIGVLEGTCAGLSVNPSSKYGLPTRGALFTALTDEGTIEAHVLLADRVSLSGEVIKFGANLPTPVRALGFTPAGTLYIAASDAVLRVLR